MYAAKQNQNNNIDELREFVRANGFGILTSQVEGKPWATHVPMVLSSNGATLTGHMARGNKQWRGFESNPDVLAIFQGPHTYISSSWYDHENVPTWNYIAVHVSGKVKIIEGEESIQSLRDLTDKYEKASRCPVSIDTMSPAVLKQNLPGIVSFEIVIEKIESSYKLSQNRDDENFRNIIRELELRGDPDSLKIAAAMRTMRPDFT